MTTIERSSLLDSLQQLQAEFDGLHGFEFPTAAEGNLARTMFSALALCGEVGELANQLKKAQRAYWLGEEEAAHIARARTEIGGVLAYLLKLSTSMGVSLEDAYLTTMSDNWLRFPVRPAHSACRILCIAGPSGVGKSSIVQQLTKHNVSAYVEEPDRNRHLTGIYEDSESFDAYASQCWFLNQIDTFVQGADAGKMLLLDQDPAAIVRVYGALLREDGRLSQEGYLSLLQQLLAVEARIAAGRGQRITVFLDADVATLKRRMQSRGERSLPSDEWLHRVRAAFLQLHSRSPKSHLVATGDRCVEEIAHEISNAVQLA